MSLSALKVTEEKWTQHHFAVSRGARPAWNVIVIDDSETHRVQLRAVIERLGDCRVEAFADANSDVIDVIEERADVVVVDQIMPECSGVDFVAKMRSRPALAKIPVIMITSDHALDLRRTALQGGVNRVQTKPINPEDVRRAIREVLPRVRPA